MINKPSVALIGGAVLELDGSKPLSVTNDFHIESVASLMVMFKARTSLVLDHLCFESR